MSQTVCGINADIGQLEAEIKLREIQMRRLPKLLTKIQLMILKRKQTLSRLASNAEELKGMAKKSPLASQTQMVVQANKSFEEFCKRFEALSLNSEAWSNKIGTAKEEMARLHEERVVEIGKAVPEDELRTLQADLATLRAVNGEAQKRMRELTAESEVVKQDLVEHGHDTTAAEYSAIRGYFAQMFSLKVKQIQEEFVEQEASLQRTALKPTPELEALEREKHELKVSIREALERFTHTRQSLIVEEKRAQKEIAKLNTECIAFRHQHKGLVSSKGKEKLELKKQTELLNSFKTKRKLLQMELGMLKGKDISQTSLGARLTKDLTMLEKDIQGENRTVLAVKRHLISMFEEKKAASSAESPNAVQPLKVNGDGRLKTLLETKKLLKSKIAEKRQELKAVAKSKTKAKQPQQSKPVQQRAARNSSRQRSLKRKEKRELQRKKRVKKKSAQLIDLFNDDVFS